MNDFKFVDFENVNAQSPEQLMSLNLEEVLPGAQGELFSQVQRVCSDQAISGHTRYQLVHFVAGDIGECVTDFGRTFQILRELGSRRSSILQAKATILKSQGSMKIALAQKMIKQKALNVLKNITHEPDEAEILRAEGSLDMIEARIWEAQGNIVSSLEQAENAYREMLIFWELYQEYIPDDYQESFDKYDSREWRARTLMRSYTGKLGYIPPLPVEETENLVKLGVVLRTLNYTEEQAALFCKGLWSGVDVLQLFVNFAKDTQPDLIGTRGPIHANDFTMSSLNPGVSIAEWSKLAEDCLKREDYEVFCENVGLNKILEAQQRQSQLQPGNARPRGR